MSSQPQTVTIAQARASTASGLLVLDSAADIVAALPNAALTARIASFTISGPAALSAAQMTLLFPIASKLHAAADSLALSGNNTFSVAQLTTFEGVPGFTVAPGGSVTLSDTTAQVVGLLASHPFWFTQIAAVTVHLDGTSIGAYPASQLSGFIAHSKPVVFIPSSTDTTLNISAAAHDLATNTAALNLLGAHQALTFTVTNDGAGISAVDAVSLTGLQGFNPAAHTLFVSDTGSNIGAHLAALLQHGFAQIQIASGTLAATATQLTDASVHYLAGAHAELSASATLTANGAAALAALPGFSVAVGAALTVADTASSLAGLTSPILAVAANEQVDASATVGAATASALAGLPHLSKAAGVVLTVQDSMANLLALSGPALAVANSMRLVPGSAIITDAAHASALAALPNFSAAGATIVVSDTLADLSAPATATWTSVATSHSVIDSASALVAGATSPLLASATSVALASPAIVTAAAGAVLASIPHFQHAQLSVADATAALIANAPAVISLACPVTVTDSATVSVAGAATLVQIAAASGEGLALGTQSLTIADTASALLGITPAEESLAATVTMNGNATVTAAQFDALRNIPHFALGGNHITISDTAADLAALTGNLTMAAGADLSADAVVTVAGFTTLAALPNFSASGHVLTVNDTAMNLAGLAGLNLSQISSVSLSANAIVTAQQAETLFAEPGFSAGGHQLVVADTASNLLALPHAVQLQANELTLSADQNVTASTLTQLASLGIKFSEAGQTVVCTDSANNLAGLSPAALALASSEVIGTSATINATTAAILAGLPNLSLSDGATLTIQDSVANLIAAGQDVPAVTTSEMLMPGSVATITAAQATALAALPHFSSTGAQITIADSFADLSAATLAALHGISNNIEVIDSAANLASSANSLLIQNAAFVALSGNAQVSAAVAAEIATIPHFSSGDYQLTVVDTAADIATHAGAIDQVAAGAVVTDGGPISAVTADALATVSATGKLSFQGGNELLVRDNFAALTSQANSTGLALAARVAVVDTAANLVVASGYDWGGVNPAYTLSQGGTIAANTAVSLAALGTHYAAGGFTLTVSDTAASVIAAGSALTSLHITASVTDSAADLASQASGLLSLGNAISSIYVADMAALSAQSAAGLASLSGLLGGPALQVADNAANAEAYLPGLAILGAHAAVTVTDSAANVASNAAGLAMLGNHLAVTLNDVTPISAITAAGLAPVAANFSTGTQIAVEDTGVHLASQAATLTTMASELGTITLSDGNVTSAAVAAALAPLDSHLSTGVMLTAIGSPNDITANMAGLASLNNDHRLAAVIVTGTAADVAGNIVAINSLPSQVNISDTAADVDAALSSIAEVNNLQNISFVDGGTPAMTMTIATVQSVSALLAKITTPYSIVVTDTAADIASDLALGPVSVIGSHLTQISQISATDGQAVTLTQAELLASGVDDGPGSALALFTGNVQATGVDIADLAHVASLTKAPTSIAIIDTAAAIASDLATGGASTLLGHAGLLTRIDATSGHSVSLTAAQALYGGIDDSAHSAIALLHGAVLVVTAASVADLPQLAALYTAPSTINVNDAAADISADLSSANSEIVAELPAISMITISDGLGLSLTEQQLLAPHVDDGPGSVLSKITGGGLAATQVAASDLTAILGLNVAPTMISVTDSAAHILSNLEVITQNLTTISTIDITTGTLTLTASEALAPDTDSGSGSMVDRVLGHVFDVTGASVAQLPLLTALPYVPATIAVTDSPANIVADLVSGHSVLANSLPLIGVINVVHGSISLTDAQADAILDSPSLNGVFAHLQSSTSVTVTGVPVADLVRVVSSGWPHLSAAIVDSAANISADLTSGSSALLADAAFCTSVALSAGGTVNASVLTQMAQLPGFATGGTVLNVQDSAAALLGLGAGALSFAHNVTVSDTGADVYANLDQLQAAFGGYVTVNLIDSTPAISVSASQYASDRATIDAVSQPHVFSVYGSTESIAALAATLGNDNAVSSVTVNDNAVNVISNLSALQAAGDKLHVTLSDTSIAANLVVPLLNIANLNPAGLPVVDTGTQVAALAESENASALSYLNTYGASLSSNSSVTVADAAALESLGSFNKAGHSLSIWDTAQHLTNTAFAAVLTNSDVDGIYLKAPNDAVTLTATQAATLFSIPGVSTINPSGQINTLIISDTAAHLDANLSALVSNRQQIGGIVVNSSATVSDQVLDDLQGLGATAANGVSLTVRDTASSIAADAISQANSHSISASAWALSGNGVVSEATAATLGTIPNFSAGPYTIALNLTSDTTISIADANRLGTLAGALNLGGYHLLVDGSVAQLAALTSGALTVVTPVLSDTIAQIAGLPLNSPLLDGSVEITGNDSVDAATVTALLNLVNSGSGQGITPSSLSIDSAHPVIDTIANLRNLTSSSGWTGNGPTHNDFHLVAQDTIANIINPANRFFLSTVSTTTLGSNVNVDASDAASLASISSGIHFDPEGHQITVQDSPSDLLNPAFANGLALANTVLLSGPSHVDASDAEALLAVPHFNLNTSLTISDSSANLLDGVMSNSIMNSGFSSHIQVQLAGPETLDAQTAESLVSIPGFSDTHDLTIADDPSYLLNSANLSAEQMATLVTLPGDEVVSTNTVLRLAGIPNFAPGDAHLILAGNDFADAPTLKAVADMGAAFQDGGYTITATANALSLTPTEYVALQSDNVILNGHLLGVLPTGVVTADSDNTLTLSGTGIEGGMLTIYAADGSTISSTSHAGESFTVSVADAGQGQNFSATESVAGQSNPGAPIVVLDAGMIESAVSAGGESFATSGGIQIDSGKFINLYQAGAVPTLTNAALVYDPSSHTLILDAPGHTPVTLITLGGSSHPSSLQASEIHFKTHG